MTRINDQSANAAQSPDGLGTAAERPSPDAEKQAGVAIEGGGDSSRSTQDRPLVSAEERVSENEIRRMRAEKLAAIRHAVASGAYDSDEILRKAVAVMVQRIDAEDPLQ